MCQSLPSAETPHPNQTLIDWSLNYLFLLCERCCACVWVVWQTACVWRLLDTQLTPESQCICAKVPMAITDIKCVGKTGSGETCNNPHHLQFGQAAVSTFHFLRSFYHRTIVSRAWHVFLAKVVKVDFLALVESVGNVLFAYIHQFASITVDCVQQLWRTPAERHQNRW